MHFIPRNIQLAVTLLLAYHPAVAGIDNFIPGARSAALSGASVASGGAEGLFQNQASLGFENQVSLLMNYESRFLVSEYSFMSAGIVYPLSDVCIGAGYRQFGTGVHKQAQTGLAVAKGFGLKLSAGLQFNYLTVRIPEVPDNIKAFNFEAGLLWRYAEHLSIGFHYIHPFQPGGYTGNIFTSLFRLGECWYISDKVSWSCDLEKQKSLPWRLRSGLEYRPVKSLFLRMGIRGIPFQPSGGIGFLFSRYRFDLAFSYHSNLGFSPTAGLIFWL